MDRTGAKLWALAHSRCSTSLRLKPFSQSGSGAVITTSHSSVIDVRNTFAVDQARHGLLGFFAGLAHGRSPAHDPPVKAQADPAPGHVKPVRVQHEPVARVRPDDLTFRFPGGESD